MTAELLAERLRRAIGTKSVNSFALSAGMNEGTVRGYLQGKMPSADKAAQLARAANVTLEWLITGEGAKEAIADVPASLPGFFDASNVPDGFVLVPRVDVEASAGGGRSIPETIDMGGMIAFRAEWLRRIGVSPRHAEVMPAKGDSMEKTIRDGDTLLVDRSIRRMVDEGIYVVTFYGNVLVKRLQHRLRGVIALTSDNPLYSEQIVTPDDRDGFAVEGRVRWIGRTI